MKYITSLVFFFVFLLANCQQKFEFGFLGGASYYMGEFNRNILFNNPKPSFAGKINYSITRRYQLDFNIAHSSFGGSGDIYLYDEGTAIANKSFSASIVDVNALLEFDFLPFDNTTKKKDNYTFYLLGGLGYSFPMSGAEGLGPHFNLPFGVGFKLCPFERMSLGAEWLYKKTWRDNIDGAVNRSTPAYSATIQNFDWYSYAGLFLAYRIFYFKGKCPAYWD